MPNAFRPGGVSPTYKPPFISGIPEEYQFIIYNRWGQQLWESSGYTEGWNGTYKGKIVQTGVYVYYLKVKQEDSAVVEIRGSFIVVL